MASKLGLPAGLWHVAPRPYFQIGLQGLSRNLPWGHQNVLPDTVKNHCVFEESGFELGATLGLGSFSKVVMANWKTYRLNVAVKIYSKKSNLGEAALGMLPQEVRMLKLLKHPNIVGFFGAWETRFRVYLVLELIGNGNLLYYLKERDAVDEAQAKKWFAQIASAVKYCHDMEVAHRDIKCENVLLDMKFNIRLSDFGFSTGEIPWFDDIPNSGWTKYNNFIGSMAYMAPEILLRQPYSPLLADVWACGVVLYSVLFGKFPFDTSQVDMDDMVAGFYLPNTVELTSECREVFQKIFVLEHNRIRSKELLHLKWLSVKTEDIYMGDTAKLTLKEVQDINDRIARRDSKFDYWTRKEAQPSISITKLGAK